jgi:hypothetical protein
MESEVGNVVCADTVPTLIRTRAQQDRRVRIVRPLCWVAALQSGYLTMTLDQLTIPRQCDEYARERVVQRTGSSIAPGTPNTVVELVFVGSTEETSGL